VSASQLSHCNTDDDGVVRLPSCCDKRQLARRSLMEPVEEDLVIILRRLMHGKMMLLFSRVAGGVLAVTLSLPTKVSAEPTHLMVRAQSLDAKFMGTHTGGVAVTVTDVRLGKVLASGMRGGSVCLNSPARLLSGASAGFTPLREAVG
jgi:hypothetical protein